jgi:hypothetical protein
MTQESKPIEKEAKVKKVKKGNFFSNMWFGIKVVTFLVIVAFSFYSGMYTVASHENDPEAKLAASIEAALASTEGTPVIIIEPKPSIVERTKMALGYEIERPVVRITTQDATKLLGIQNEEPGYVKAAIMGTKKFTSDAWGGTKSIASKSWTWTKDAATGAYTWATNWGDE